jgi:hypothetical protein
MSMMTMMMMVMMRRDDHLRNEALNRAFGPLLRHPGDDRIELSSRSIENANREMTTKATATIRDELHPVSRLHYVCDCK